MKKKTPALCEVVCTVQMQELEKKNGHEGGRAATLRQDCESWSERRPSSLFPMEGRRGEGRDRQRL